MTVLSHAAFVTGCELTNRTNETERLQESAAKQYEAAQDATQEAIQAAGNYAVAPSSYSRIQLPGVSRPAATQP